MSLSLVVALGACDLVPLTVGSAAKSAKRGRASMKMESDFEMAYRALPGSLKTLETFHAAAPKNKNLIGLLAEGYCQYASGFVEDDWEVARFEEVDLDKADYQSRRITKMYIRCMNYGFKLLGKEWKLQLFDANQTQVATMLAKVGHDKRNALMWTAIGLGGQINYNKDNIALVAQAPTVIAMLRHVISLDKQKFPKDRALAAVPHMVLGMIYAAQSPALGGDHKKSEWHFRRAMAITKNKRGQVRYLLAKVNFARRLLVAQQKRNEFHKLLQEVLRTPGAIWPEQRLANEVAHRRALRYLKLEKKWF